MDNNMPPRSPKRKTAFGFTLIELLVVISIISMLASVVLSSLGEARKKARDARRLIDIKQIQTALDIYYEKEGHYPITSAVGVSSYQNPSFLSDIVKSVSNPSGTYPRTPEDPLNTSPAFNYWYKSRKTDPLGPSAQAYEMDYDVETSGTPCISGGKFAQSNIPSGSRGHCHLFYPRTVCSTDPYDSDNEMTGLDCSNLDDSL